MTFEESSSKEEGSVAPEPQVKDASGQDTVTTKAQDSVEISLSLEKDSLLQESDLKEIEALAKEHGFKQETANGALSLSQKLVKSYVQREQEKFDKQRDTWVDQVKSNSEFGGEKLKESTGFAQRANDKFGSEDLTNYLNEGPGDNPELFAFFARVGKAMADDKREKGVDGASKQEVSLAEKLYGKTG